MQKTSLPTWWSTLFPKAPAVLAMIHVRALPGTPMYDGNTSQILNQALAEARIYREAGVDGIILENMHDTPYLKGGVGPEITAWMTRVATAVKAESGLPCGVQVLAGANREAMAVAQAAGLDFVRVEGFVFGHIADEGWMEANAGELLRYRKKIGAEQVRILADIKKKHSAHAVTADVDLVETAKAASFFRTDGVIITGSSTAMPTDGDAVRAVQRAVRMPVLVGSGVTAENVAEYAHADGLIVGSWLKRDGYWENEVDPERVKALMKAVRVCKFPSSEEEG